MGAYCRLPFHFIAVSSWVFLGTWVVVRPGIVVIARDPVYSFQVLPGYPSTPNTNLLIFGFPSQRPQEYQQSIRLTVATLGVSLASA